MNDLSMDMALSMSFCLKQRWASIMVNSRSLVVEPEELEDLFERAGPGFRSNDPIESVLCFFLKYSPQMVIKSAKF